MPTTRQRRGRNLAITPQIIATIGIGCGINSMPPAELRQLWQEHGAAVTAHWRRLHGPDAETFVGMLARVEGW